MGTKVIVPGQFEHFRCERRRTLLVSTDVETTFNEVARLTARHRAVLARIARQEQIKQLAVIFEAARLDAPLLERLLCS